MLRKPGSVSGLLVEVRIDHKLNGDCDAQDRLLESNFV